MKQSLLLDYFSRDVLCYFGHLDMVGHVMALLEIHPCPEQITYMYLSRARVHSNNAIERGTAAHHANAMGRNS